MKTKLKIAERKVVIALSATLLAGLALLFVPVADKAYGLYGLYDASDLSGTECGSMDLHGTDIMYCGGFNTDSVVFDRESCTPANMEVNNIQTTVSLCRAHGTDMWGVYTPDDSYADDDVSVPDTDTPAKPNEAHASILDGLPKDSRTGCAVSTAADGSQWLASLAASATNPAFTCPDHPATAWIQPSASYANPVTICRHGFWDGAETLNIYGQTGCMNLWFTARPDNSIFMPWKRPDFLLFLAKFFNGRMGYCMADPLTGLCLEDLCVEDDDGNCMEDLRWSTTHQIGECKSLKAPITSTHNYETDVEYVYTIGSNHDRGEMFLSYGNTDELKDYWDQIGDECNKILVDVFFRVAGLTGAKCPADVEEGEWRLDKILLGNGQRYASDGGDSKFIWKNNGPKHFVLRSQCIDYTKSPLLAEYYGLTE